MTGARRITVAMLAFGAEPLLVDAVHAVLASEGVEARVVLVDNGCTGPGVGELQGLPGLTILRPPVNLGFAAGCNLALNAATDEHVALVNSDAIVAPDALSELVDALRDHTIGIATALVRQSSDPSTVNSVGNPFSFVGLSWAGGMGEPVEHHAQPTDVAGASGACCALRRDTWQDLGGFHEAYFCYHEDTDLSLRSWQRGLRVRYVPSASAVHHYEWGRNPQKNHLLERNRLLTLLTDLQLRTLLLLLPALLVTEIAMTFTAFVQGWGPAKVSGWTWLLVHRDEVRARRRWVQAHRLVPDRRLNHTWTGSITPPGHDLPPGTGVLDRSLRVYWALVRRFL
jgi:GT2 family glycosyltransferase